MNDVIDVGLVSLLSTLKILLTLLYCIVPHVYFELAIAGKDIIVQ